MSKHFWISFTSKDVAFPYSDEWRPQIDVRSHTRTCGASLPSSCSSLVNEATLAVYFVFFRKTLCCQCHLCLLSFLSEAVPRSINPCEERVFFTNNVRSIGLISEAPAWHSVFHSTHTSSNIHKENPPDHDVKFKRFTCQKQNTKFVFHNMRLWFEAR